MSIHSKQQIWEQEPGILNLEFPPLKLVSTSCIYVVSLHIYKSALKMCDFFVYIQLTSSSNKIPQPQNWIIEVLLGYITVLTSKEPQHMVNLHILMTIKSFAH